MLERVVDQNPYLNNLPNYGDIDIDLEIDPEFSELDINEQYNI